MSDQTLDYKAKRSLALIQEMGVDPFRLVQNEMGRDLVLAYAVDRLNDVEFMRAVRNLSVLSPSLMAAQQNKGDDS